jgi:hypothetical protein
LKSSFRQKRSLRRGLASAAAGAMVIALFPVGIAAADPRGTENVCPPPGEVESQQFDDVTEANVHRRNINCVAQYGIAQGTAPRIYSPRASVTRGQMATYIANMVQVATGEPLSYDASDDYFGDIADSVHRNNIRRLAEANIVQGVTADQYRPGARVNRDAMATFIRRAIDYVDDGQVNNSIPPAPAPGYTFPFLDVTPLNVHYNSIARLHQQAIVAGTSSTTYSPGNPVRRDQMATFVMQAADYLHSLNLWAPTATTAAVTITVEPQTVTAGDDVTVTFTGDVDQIDSIAVAGDCIEDGMVTLDENDAVTFTTDADFDGECVITFTVTYDDGSTQTVMAEFTVEAPVGPSVTITPVADTVTVGDDLVLTFEGDLDQITSITATGACIEDGPVDFDDNDNGDTITFPTADWDAGACVITFTITYDDDSEQTVDVTVTLVAPTVTITPAADAVLVGDDIVFTFDGDVDRIDTIAVASACIEDDDYDLVDGTLTFSTDDLEVGPCVFAFTITYADGTVQTVEVTVDVVTPSVTITPEVDTVTIGEDIVLTFEGNVDRIDTITAAGACIEDGEVTLADGVATFPTAELDEGECVITFTVTYTDGTTQDVPVTVTLEEAALFQPGEFTMTVETGGIVIGAGEEDAFAIDFTECPGGVPTDEGAECITFSGTIDADGDFTVQPEDVFFPDTVIVHSGSTVAVSTGVSAPVTGTVDPATGEASFDLPMQVLLDIAADGTDDCGIAIVLDGTTGTSGGLEGAALGQDGRLTVVEGLFAVPVTDRLSSVGDSLCGIVDDLVGLPSGSGGNTAVFELLLTQD